MTKIKSCGRRVLTAAVAIVMAFAVALVGLAPTTAYAGEAEVRQVGNGVFKFNWRYDGVPYSRGSCFLINEDHVLTCWHCAMFSTEELVDLELDGVDTKDLVKKFDYTVNIHRDVQVGAELVNYSEEEDWAIFKLDQKVGNSSPIIFRDSQTVEAAETVWSVGFPASSDLKAIQTYDSKDVTIKRGTVSKPEGLYQGKSGGWYINGNLIQTDCPISGGDSGGPMVDDNGYVIGISELSTDEFYLAIATHNVLEAFDRLKIEYKSIDGGSTLPTDTTTTEPADEPTVSTTKLDNALKDAQEYIDAKDSYTADSIAKLEDAIEEGEDALKSDDQDEIDDAAKAINDAIKGLEDAPKGLPVLLIAGIAAAIALIGGLVAFFIVRSRKKKAAAPAAMPVTPNPDNYITAPAVNQTPGGAVTMPPAFPGDSFTTQPASMGPSAFDNPATTVLYDDNPATTILGEDVYGGTLTRMSNNEVINIDRSEISLGRERSSVDYCLEGNSNISRVHARIIVRDNTVYIVDNNTPNGTYVNNAKLRPGLEQQLKSGDIVRLADEKFRYNR